MNITYYRTFASYRIPFYPQGELLYRETQGLNSFYIGYHDASGRLLQFVKLLLERVSATPEVLNFTGEPGLHLYFRAERNAPNSGTVTIGEQIAYEDTEASTEFFAGSVETSGAQATLFHLRKQQAFRDFYLYDRSGKLKERLLLRRDTRSSAWSFDKAGNAHAMSNTTIEISQAVLSGQSTESLSLEISGTNADEATVDLQSELKAEGIPQRDIKIATESVGSAVARIGLVVAPILAPLVVEAIYKWLTTRQAKDTNIGVHVGEKQVKANVDHFDRRELIEVFSDSSTLRE